MSADNARMLRLRDDDEQIAQPLLASALLTLSMLVVPHMDAIAKYLGMQGHHVLQLTWLRMASQCASRARRPASVPAAPAPRPSPSLSRCWRICSVRVALRDVLAASRGLCSCRARAAMAQHNRFASMLGSRRAPTCRQTLAGARVNEERVLGPAGLSVCSTRAEHQVCGGQKCACQRICSPKKTGVRASARTRALRCALIEPQRRDSQRKSRGRNAARLPA